MISIMYYSLSLIHAVEFDHLNANCSSKKAEIETKLSTRTKELFSRYRNISVNDFLQHTHTNMEFPRTGLISNTWLLRQTHFPAFLLSVCARACDLHVICVWVLQGHCALFILSLSLSLQAWPLLRRSRSLTCPSWWLPSTAWQDWLPCSPVWLNT